jgi:hypothetical protein
MFNVEVNDKEIKNEESKMKNEKGESATACGAQRCIAYSLRLAACS